MATRKRSTLRTAKVYRALRRKGYDDAKAGAIANASRTFARRSEMARKGRRTRRLRG